MLWDSESLWAYVHIIMDKIDSSAISSLFPSFQPGLKAETKKTKTKDELRGTKKTFFSEIMGDFLPGTEELGPIKILAPSENAVAELMDAVHSAGSELKERPFPEEIIRFKRAVRNFVHYVVENSYEVEKVQGMKKKTVVRGETRWLPTRHHQVKVIDQKLEELAAWILSKQTSQLEMVSKLDEITGLLVDLTISGVIRERNE